MPVNAEEYLRDFCSENCVEWLKYIIHSVIQEKEPLSEVKGEMIADCLLNDKSFPEIINVSVGNFIYSSMTIKELVHHCGVNALLPEQTIKFSNDATVLFGLNGSGKSGYFRILHEIIGGKQEKAILANIYADINTPFSASLVYKLGNETKTLEWNGQRACPDFYHCKVFDSCYVASLLSKREIDETIVMPLGLNLFPKINQSLEGIKNVIARKKDNIISSMERIDSTLFTDENKSLFNEHELSEASAQKIRSFLTFTDAREQDLKTLAIEISNLEQADSKDTIKLEEQKRDSLQKICLQLESESRKYSEFWSTSRELLKEYSLRKTESDAFLKKVEILRTIPASNTPEWKSFIQAAEKYKKALPLSPENQNICVYCRQALDADRARDIIKSYEEFLSNEAERLLDNIVSKIQTLKNTLLQSPLQLDCSDIAKEAIVFYAKSEEDIKSSENQAVKAGDNLLLNKVISCIATLNGLRESIIHQLTSFEIGDFSGVLDFKNIVVSLKLIIDKLNENIIELSADREAKSKRIIDLKKRYAVLLENQSFANQKIQIEKWLKDDLMLKKASEKINALSANMRAISTLSGRAHDELLTDKLKKAFREELDALGHRNLCIEITKGNTVKGRSSTELIIKTQKNINAILSEGEQKAVALSLFIAELKMHPAACPIIFDDPVNSLDHKIAAEFAIRLLTLPRQIIIFTHNRLFLDAFECANEHHVCKTIETSCSKNKGKHIRIYEIKSEGISQKGFVVPMVTHRTKDTIKAMNLLLQKIPFDDTLKVSALARQTVEYIIDEKILNNVIPTKYSNKNSRIQWEIIEKINPSPELLEKLKKIHSRLSGGDLHNGTERLENPIDKEGLQEIVNELNAIYSESVIP